MKFDYEKFILVSVHIWLFTGILVAAKVVSFSEIYHYAIGWTIGCFISGFLTVRNK